MPAEVSAGRSLYLVSSDRVTIESNLVGSRLMSDTLPMVTPPIFTGACARSWPIWLKRAVSVYWLEPKPQRWLVDATASTSSEARVSSKKAPTANSSRGPRMAIVIPLT